MKKILFLLLIFISSVFAQQIKIKGVVVDASTGTALSFANIRAAGSTIGTAANLQGEFSLLLPKGSIKLIASYIGFTSDTLDINLTESINVNFLLRPAEVYLQEITVLSSSDPALLAIQKAVEKKKVRAEKLKSYEYEAYTKGVIRSDKEVKVKNRTLAVDPIEKDSAGLRIAGIFENHSRGYLENNNYKEFILAQKQTANFSSTINILTGGRIIQSFYEDHIDFFDKQIPSPISEAGLTYYTYSISNLTAIDNKTVLEIYFTPTNINDPGFTGFVYISDPDYNFLKIETELNSAANPGGIFERVHIFQQFNEFADEIYMPIDYRLFFQVNILGLARASFELNSILYDYKLNKNLSENIFDNAILTVMPEADKKDPSYWNSINTIPNSNEEISAYKKIDSIASQPINYLSNMRSTFLSNKMMISENFYTSGILGLYHFNRVEGNTINFAAFAENLNNKRLSSSLKTSYGFADEKFKYDYNLQYLLGDYRTTSIKFNYYDKLKTLFQESDSYNKFTASALALFTKYEFRNYFYSKGGSIEFRFDALPFLRLGFGLSRDEDKSAYKNSDYSFFNKDKKFDENSPVNEGITNMLGVSFKLDHRKVIEDGYFKTRTDQGKSYIVFEGSINNSSIEFLNSGFNFTSYDIITRGAIYTGAWGKSSYFIEGFYSDGATPLQFLFPQSGNINFAVKENTIRTIQLGEFFGDEGAKVYLKHNFGDKIFRELKIPFIKNLQLQFSGFVNVAYSKISNETLNILPEVKYKEFKRPLYEAGFQIGHILLPFALDFAWRLNYRDENNFSFGIITQVL